MKKKRSWKMRKKPIVSKIIMSLFTFIIISVIIMTLFTGITNAEKTNRVRIQVRDENNLGMNGFKVYLKDENEKRTEFEGITDYQKMWIRNETYEENCDGIKTNFNLIYIVMDRNGDKKIDENDVYIYRNKTIIKSIERIDKNIIEHSEPPEVYGELKASYIGRGLGGIINWTNVPDGKYKICLEDNKGHLINSKKVYIDADSNFYISLHEDNEIEENEGQTKQWNPIMILSIVSSIAVGIVILVKWRKTK